MKKLFVTATGMLLATTPALAQQNVVTPDRPNFAEERPFAEPDPKVNPRRIAKARKKATRIKAARIKQARLKHKRIEMHRIKMAKRKAAGR